MVPRPAQAYLLDSCQANGGHGKFTRSRTRLNPNQTPPEKLTVGGIFLRIGNLELMEHCIRPANYYCHCAKDYRLFSKKSKIQTEHSWDFGGGIRVIAGPL